MHQETVLIFSGVILLPVARTEMIDSLIQVYVHNVTSEPYSKLCAFFFFFFSFKGRKF